ncbi:GSCOCG00009293001-RA-CDS [Cotesia congregata]|uniref:Similar to SPG7: Paraplegin (Homo sapiens) n=1 Tax=Cotesia congregata TaxID=51543 RepID=A0A8J2H9N7_COTCN|nr:GSCOCG00009293001-RA-CDS [Cotesia congregata]CAG5084643.1 Similar to SPG7: Paraplegin (Homo sapiens) [Cotesia congregata]
MQNIAKSTHRHLFLPKYFISSVVNLKPKEKKYFNRKFIKFWKESARNIFSSFPHNNFNTFSTECRSLGFYILSQNQFYQKFTINKLLKKQFGTSSVSHNKPSSSNGSQNSSDNKPPNQGDEKVAFIKLFLISCFVYGIFIYPMQRMAYKVEESPFVSWNEFVHKMLAKGEVQELIIKPDIDWVTIVLHDGAVINGKRSILRTYQMIVADATQLEEKLREAEKALGIPPGQGVPIVYQRVNENTSFLIALAVTIGILIAVSRSVNKSGLVRRDMFGGITRAKFTLVDPLTGGGKGVRFVDVAGLKEAKIEVMEFVDYLKRPEHYKALGAKVPKGALLLGPPGCGKTMLAKAVATEANVPFLSMNGSEFIEMIGGLGAARVRDLFAEARKRSPSILYIDEIDAIGKKRSGGSGMNQSTGESEQTLNQLLVEMDGMATKEGIIVLASTNRAEVLDKALLRPGRFDRHILIDLPTLPERKEIFDRYLSSIVLDKKPEVYSPRLAQLTPGFSGADIANVCNEAALHAARFKKKAIDASDISYAIDRVICGPEKKNHGVSPAEREIVAYHEAGHALVAWLLESTDALLKVTIKPTTRGVLGFAQYTPTERRNYSKEQLYEMMCVALGGRAAENVVFNRITTGAQNDLQKVTKIAYTQVRQLGMSDKVGLVSYSEEETGTNTKKPYSKKLANLMDMEARQLVAKSYKDTEKLLKNNMDKLEKISQMLLKQETLTYEEVEGLIGPPPFGKKKKVDCIELDESTSTTIENSPETQSTSQVSKCDKIIYNL